MYTHACAHSTLVNWNILRTNLGVGGGWFDNLLAVLGFKQMDLQNGFKCSGWPNVSNFIRQRISDKRSSIGNRMMSKCFHNKVCHQPVWCPNVSIIKYATSWLAICETPSILRSLLHGRPPVTCSWWDRSLYLLEFAANWSLLCMNVCWVLLPSIEHLPGCCLCRCDMWCLYDCCVGDFLLRTVDGNDSDRESPPPAWDQPTSCSPIPG